MLENVVLTPGTLMTIAVGGVLWIVMLILVVKYEFKKPKFKKIWLIALLSSLLHVYFFLL